jgi:hypothetical protein
MAEIGLSGPGDIQTLDWKQVRHRASRYPNRNGSRMFTHISPDGKNWSRFERAFEVSGYHHNVRGGFLSLKPG